MEWWPSGLCRLAFLAVGIVVLVAAVCVRGEDQISNATVSGSTPATAGMPIATASPNFTAAGTLPTSANTSATTAPFTGLPTTATAAVTALHPSSDPSEASNASSATREVSLTLADPPAAASLGVLLNGVSGAGAAAVIVAGPLRAAFVGQHPTPVGVGRAMQPMLLLQLAARCMERAGLEQGVSAPFPAFVIGGFPDASGVVVGGETTSSTPGGAANGTTTALTNGAASSRSPGLLADGPPAGLGALAGGSLSSAAVVAVVWGAAITLTRRHPPSNAAPAANDIDDAQLRPRAAAGMALSVVAWLTPGIGTGATAVGVYGDAGATAYAASAVLLLASLGSVLYVGWILLQSLRDDWGTWAAATAAGKGEDAGVSDVSSNDDDDDDGDDGAGSYQQRRWSRIRWRVWYHDARCRTSFIHRVAPLVDAAASFVVGAVSGSLPATAEDCGFAFGVAGAFLLAPLLFAVVVRPYRGRADTVSAMAAAGLAVLQAAIASVASTRGADDAAQDQGALNVVAVCAVLQYGVLLAAPAVAAYVAFQKGAGAIRGSADAAPGVDAKARKSAKRHQDGADSPAFGNMDTNDADDDDAEASASVYDDEPWTFASCVDELPDAAFVPPPPPGRPIPRGRGRLALPHLTRVVRPGAAAPRRGRRNPPHPAANTNSSSGSDADSSRAGGDGPKQQRRCLPPWAEGFYTLLPEQPEDGRAPVVNPADDPDL